MIYGWNSYLLKAFVLGDFGYMDPSISSIRIEYRQKYAHLMFIPFFSLGKMWVIRRDGKMYEPSAEILNVIKSHQVRTRNGIWAWSGILLALLVFFIYSINEKLESRRYEKYAAVQRSAIDDFVSNKKATQGILDKTVLISDLIDSLTAEVKPSKTKIDTAKSLSYFLDALATQTDSLSGYSEENTFVFHRMLRSAKLKEKDILPSNVKNQLTLGSSGSYYSDTASFFREVRRIQNLKYLFVLTEYNRLDPKYGEDQFTPGITMGSGQLVDLDTRKVIKSVKFFASNSDTVSTYRMTTAGRSAQMSASEWEERLKSDLDYNLIKVGKEYVFHNQAEIEARSKRITRMMNANGRINN